MNLNNQTKILWVGDLVVNSGFGRIGNEVTSRLFHRGWQQIMGVSPLWDGYPPSPLPFYVRPGAQDLWARAAQMVNDTQPDVVVVCQDFPYAQTMFQGTRLDWSKTKFIIVTPIDGTPIHPDWLSMVDLADATMVISKFGVEGMRLSGKRVELLHPGVDTNEFYPAESPDEVAALREKMGLPADAFVVGMFAMNQGRKAISATVAAFHEFARDKANAYLYLDMDATSPAGWDIPVLCQQIGLDMAKVRFRHDAVNAGIGGLRERILLCDVNSVISHREGFGLPLLEGMACKVVAMALDWCSGSEIAGAGKGMLVRRIDYMEHGTWGGARDAFPDVRDWISKLNTLYKEPGKKLAIAERGYEWAIEQTWDKAADSFEAVLKQVVQAQQKERASEPAESNVTIPAPGLSDVYGPSYGERPDPGVQPVGDGVSVHGIDGDNHQPGDNGDHRQRRLQPDLQPDGAVPAAGDQGTADAA